MENEGITDTEETEIDADAVDAGGASAYYLIVLPLKLTNGWIKQIFSIELFFIHFLIILMIVFRNLL